MQNRYTGDIGDFGKLGLLRRMSGAGFSVGVNWYMTPDESHNGDGRHIGYLRNESFLFFVKHFSLKKASKFPVFVKGFSLLSAGTDYASLRMRACSIR